MVKFFLSLLLVVALIQPTAAIPKEKVIIFSAGSLAKPLEVMEKAFEKANPNIDLQIELSGSRKAARKVCSLHKPCDIVISADYLVIKDLLYPKYASWLIRFAKNEMVIAYTPKSKYANEINSSNWYKVLLKPGVRYGHSDPNIDPCGYRTLMVWQLAEKYYKEPGLYEKLVKGCPKEYIRPKSVELIALLESGHMDYAWEYISVARQHGLKFVRLPKQINLSSVKYADFYREAKVKVSGKKPGTFVEYTATPIVYGLTLIKNAQNRNGALKFLKYFLSENGGLKVLKDCYQTPIIPPVGEGKGIPEEILSLIKR